MSMVESLDEIYRRVWWNLLMISTDEYGEISWFLNHVQRTTDPVLLVYIGILTAPYIGCLHWNKMELLHVLVPMCPGYPIDPGCSVSWMSLLHEPSRESRASSGCSISWMFPLREDGASAFTGDPGCPVSRVSLLHEPSQESRASF